MRKVFSWVFFGAPNRERSGRRLFSWDRLRVLFGDRCSSALVVVSFRLIFGGTFFCKDSLVFCLLAAVAAGLAGCSVS